uniref:Serine/threonine-protein kinase atg1 n=1 Tax=Lygus hesperus TaxID=30085 RepID=A0A0A9W1X7_LYGHE
MGDSNRWSHQLQLDFLEAYQSEPVIWDPKHGEHKDRRKINDAWGRIEALIGKPIKELKTKRDSLMATYRSYSRKVAASAKSGASGEDIYKPVWFAYELMDQFLGTVYNCGPTVNTKKRRSNLENVQGEEDPPSNSEGLTQEEPGGLISGSRRTIRRRSDPPEQHDAAKQMRTAFDTLNKVLEIKRDTEDECDLFGKLIAKKLKKMPEHEREDVMFEIERVFHNVSTRYRPPHINSAQSSSHSTPSPSPSLFQPTGSS